jgi:transposase InsO family protein
MCYLLPFNIAIVCLLLSVYLLLSRFPIRPTTASFPLHWGEKFTRTLLKAPQSQPTTPDYCSATMAQVAFMAAKSHGDLEISSVILLDTGCSQHTFCKKSDFDEIRYFQPHEMNHGITGIGKTFFQPIGVGTVKINCSVQDSRRQQVMKTLYLTNALYCPSLQANLISASQLLDKDINISLTKSGCVIAAPDGDTAAEARAEHGLFLLTTWSDQQRALAAYSSSNDPIHRLWHERMGHLGMQNLKKLQNMSTGLDLSHLPHEDCTCEACLKGRMRDVPHRHSLAQNTKPYEVIFSDVEGPMSVTGHEGSRFFVTFLDACTKESEVSLVKYKSEVPAMFRRYKASKERPNEGRVIRRVHSDGGGEYLGFDFQLDLAEEGITFTYSTPASQQQNGTSERLNLTLLNKAHAMMDGSELPKKYWPEAVIHANYLRNRSPVNSLKTTPFEAATGRIPDLSHIRVFGCKVWYRQGSQAKFKTLVDDKAIPGTFLGFGGSHIIRILNDQGRIVRATAAHFQEQRTGPPGGAKRQCLERLDYNDESDLPIRTAWFSDPDGVQTLETSHIPIPTTSPRGHEPREPYNLRSQGITPLAHLSTAKAFALMADMIPAEPYEPKSWKDAMSHNGREKWFQAANDEMDSLISNSIWSLVDPPANRNVLKGRWVFKYKRGPSGDVIRYKARWVVKGYEQQQGIDYHETFASVVKPMSYKALFAITAAVDLEIEQMDVKTAFLYGAVQEDIFVEQPHGLSDGSGRVCKLNKALYGLKQSPRVWYKTLSTFLCEAGFTPLDADHSVFVKNSTYIAVYVDDLLLVGPNKVDIQLIKSQLSQRFKMTDMGPIAYYLGMTVSRDRQNRILRLGQRSYLTEGIKTMGLWNSSQQKTPVNTGHLEPAGEGYCAEPEFKTQYQSAVGTLMYAMLGTRPDIAYAVSSVSRYAANPTKAHMAAVKRIFSYLRGTLDLQLTFRGELTDLVGYSDSDWGGDPITHRSTAGFVLFQQIQVVSITGSYYGRTVEPLFKNTIGDPEIIRIQGGILI